MKTLLNLGSGKIDTDSLRYQSYTHVVHVDRYFDEKNAVSISQVEEYIIHAVRSGCNPDSIASTFRCCKADIFEFLDTFRYKFDDVIAERIFEHMEYCNGEIGRLLEAINILTRSNAILTIVVPNAELLSLKLLQYEENHSRMNHIEAINTKLILNTDFCNIRQDPHLSVWSPVLAKEYIESEGSWIIDNITSPYHFANRDIYMKIVCTKPKEKK